MPAGMYNMKQLDKLVSAALLQALSNTPPSGSTPAATHSGSFLSDPAFLAALNTGTGLPAPTGQGRQSNTTLPANVSSLETSVNRMGFKQEHQSLLGKIFGTIERPFYGIAGGLHAGIEKAVEHEIASGGSVKGLFDPKDMPGRFKAAGGGFVKGIEGKEHYTGADILDAADPDPNHKTMPGLAKGLLGFGIDVGLDPLTFTGVGSAVKVKNLGRTAENVNKILKVRDTLEAAGEKGTANIPQIFLGGGLKEGKWLKAKDLPNSAMRANAMRQAVKVSKLYGQLSFNELFKANRIEAEKELAKQGTRRYDNLQQMRKLLKGDATETELRNWNSHVGHLIETRASELSGKAETHVAAKAGELLDIATHSNLVRSDVAKQLDKRLAVRMAGKDIAHIKLPQPLIQGVKAAAMSDKVAKVRDPIVAAHDLTNRLFRTGAHVEPLVNAMRAARQSSVIEKINRHVEDTKSIWGGVANEDRKRIAEAVVRNLDNVKVAGGVSKATGQHVDDLVAHVNEQLDHIQSLVGKHKGALVTLDEFNKALPREYRLSKKFATGDQWLRNAWHQQYLDRNAAWGLKRIANDPATFIHFMQKGLFTAAADKELKNQIITRFGHQLRGVAKGTKNQLDVATKVLRDSHGYRSPKYISSEGKSVTIPGYEKHIFHPDVAKGIEAVHTMMEVAARSNHMTTTEMHQAFNTATSIFKTVVTKFNPGFHERNLMGEVASGLADGVYKPRWFRASAQVLRLHGKTALDTGEVIGSRRTLVTRQLREDSRVHNAILPDAYERARIAPIRGNDIVTKKRFFTYAADGTRHSIPGVTADMYWHAYVENGLKTGFITTEFGKTTEGGVLRRAAKGPNTAAQHLTENIEDYARLAHFISRVERSGIRNFEQAAEEAATYVRKFHFDYNDFTHFEKNVVSRAIPFYKWTRKNIPLQMALMFQKPGYMLTQMKALNGIAQANGYRNNGNIIPDAGEVMPSWLKDALAVPVGAGGSGTRYLDAPLPTRDAFKFFGAGPRDFANNLGFMTNPFVKDPIEYLTGHQIGGAPIQTDRYLAAMTPYTNLIHNLHNSGNTGKGTNLLQFLSGLGLVENTPARMKSELKREQSAQSAARKKYRTSHGALPVGGRPR